MSVILWKITVGGLEMSLREARGPNYTMVYRLVTDPIQVALTYLGCDRSHAVHIFARKVECHRMLVGDVHPDEVA